MVIHHIVHRMDVVKYVLLLLLLFLLIFYIILFYFRIVNIIPLVTVVNSVLRVTKVMLFKVQYMIVNQFKSEHHLHYVNIYSI